MPRPDDSPARRAVLLMFGQRLRQLRLDRDLTQAALAARAGVVRNYITDLEGGKVAPTLLLLVAIAAGLGITLEELLGPKLLALRPDPAGTDPAAGSRRARGRRRPADG